MMATSPIRSRLVRFLVRRSSRAGPITPGRSSGLLRCLIGSFRNGAIIVSHPARPMEQTRPHTASPDGPAHRPTQDVPLPLRPRPAPPQPPPASPGAPPPPPPAPPLAPRRGAPRGGGEQQTRVRPGIFGVLEAGQHPGQLGDPP